MPLSLKLRCWIELRVTVLVQYLFAKIRMTEGDAKYTRSRIMMTKGSRKDFQQVQQRRQHTRRVSCRDELNKS
jgi:hypothetical protein